MTNIANVEADWLEIQPHMMSRFLAIQSLAGQEYALMDLVGPGLRRTEKVARETATAASIIDQSSARTPGHEQ